MTPAEFEDAKALWKFFYAHECFRQVENACSFIIDNSLDDSHPAYYPLVTAIYVLYGKPFKRSDVVGKLPSDIVPARFEGLHKSIIGHRDQLYAHTDAKAFASANHEAANQVRVLVSPTEARLFAILFQARLPVIPKVLELCRALQRKANHHVKKLQKRHYEKVPVQSGEYAVNVLDAAGPFWLKKPALLSASKEA